MYDSIRRRLKITDLLSSPLKINTCRMNSYFIMTDLPMQSNADNLIVLSLFRTLPKSCEAIKFIFWQDIKFYSQRIVCFYRAKLSLLNTFDK